jgi:D-xylose transport system ATP-binding protein
MAVSSLLRRRRAGERASALAPAAAGGLQASTDAGAPLLALQGIGKHYGSVEALTDVDFTIHPSEIHALVGDNGAGKSSLIKVISGAHRPDAGTITTRSGPARIDTPEGAAHLGIATVYQHLALVDTRTVTENVFLGREPTRWLMVDRRTMTTETRSALDRLGINIASIRAEVGSLSGGQRQAIAIARAVQEGHGILLLDEPTAALGVRESRAVLDLILRLKEEGISIVWVSHNLHQVFEITDRITVLRGGRLVGSRLTAQTSPDEIVGMITGANLV